MLAASKTNECNTYILQLIGHATSLPMHQLPTSYKDTWIMDVTKG